MCGDLLLKNPSQIYIDIDSLTIKYLTMFNLMVLNPSIIILQQILLVSVIPKRGSRISIKLELMYIY